MKEFTAKVAQDPYMKFLGITVEKVEKGHAVCSLVVRPDMLNFLGLLHGGLVFSLADAAFSAASNSDYSPSYALDVSGSFLKTAAVGETITAEATLVHTTKRTGLYRMNVSRGDELMATFNGTVFRKV